MRNVCLPRPCHVAYQLRHCLYCLDCKRSVSSLSLQKWQWWYNNDTNSTGHADNWRGWTAKHMSHFPPCQETSRWVWQAAASWARALTSRLGLQKGQGHRSLVCRILFRRSHEMQPAIDFYSPISIAIQSLFGNQLAFLVGTTFINI